MVDEGKYGTDNQTYRINRTERRNGGVGTIQRRVFICL